MALRRKALPHRRRVLPGHMWRSGLPCSGARHRAGLHLHTTDCPQGKGNAMSLAMQKRLGTRRK